MQPTPDMVWGVPFAAAHGGRTAATARHRGVHRPEFFTFTAYAAMALLPVFVLRTLLFFL